MKKGSGQRILGGVVALWGGAVVLHGLFSGPPAGASEAYSAGYTGGTIFGAVLFVVGLYYLIKG